MTYNFLIIGAGVSGLSVAVSLLQRGHRVTVLDRGDAGGESSWAGGGILSPLLPWEYGDAMTALALRSMASYANWLRSIEALAGVEAEFWRCGLLALDIVDADWAQAWCANRALLATRDVGLAKFLGRGPSPAQSALYLPEIAQVRNPRLIATLVAAIKRLGGRIYEHCTITGIHTHARRITAIQSSSQEWTSDSAILATGAWAGAGLGTLAPVPHIRPIRGQMLLYKLAPGALNTIVYRHGVYLIPRRDGHVLVGSTLEDAGFDKAIDPPTRARLHAEAAALLPQLHAVQPIRHWSGLRPGSPDNIPIIDRHPDFDNVFVNTGHYRYGVTMAPASAELLADLIEGKTPALDPKPYSWQAALSRSWGDKL